MLEAQYFLPHSLILKYGFLPLLGHFQGFPIHLPPTSPGQNRTFLKIGLTREEDVKEDFQLPEKISPWHSKISS